MSEILVLVDHAEGPDGVSVKKPTYEMLTLAARLGEPSAVFIGPKGQGSEVAAAVKKYGAGTVYVVDDEALKGYLVAPKAEALQQVMEKSSPGRRTDLLVRRGQGDRRPTRDQDGAPG